MATDACAGETSGCWTGTGGGMGDGGVARRVAFKGDLERINKIACPINTN